MVWGKESMKDKKQGGVQFFDVDAVSLEYQEHHFELNAKSSGAIRYRNMLSPPQPDMNFPKGFFDEKTAFIDSERMK